MGGSEARRTGVGVQHRRVWRRGGRVVRGGSTALPLSSERWEHELAVVVGGGDGDWIDVEVDVDTGHCL